MKRYEIHFIDGKIKYVTADHDVVTRGAMYFCNETGTVSDGFLFLRGYELLVNFSRVDWVKIESIKGGKQDEGISD